MTPLPGLSIYPQEPLSTVCSQLPTSGLSCALRFIHLFIQQKSTGSFFTPGTALGSASNIELGQCQPISSQIGIYIDITLH